MARQMATAALTIPQAEQEQFGTTGNPLMSLSGPTGSVLV